MRLRHLVLPAVATLVVGFAPPASAVVTVGPDYVDSDAAGDLIRPTCSGGFLGSTGTATLGDACATITSIGISAKGGADTVDLSFLNATAFPALTSVSITLGDDSDEDTATGSPFDDTFTGNEGIGDTASGGAGDDTFVGVASAVGGLGDDVFTKASDFASGGPGDDRFVQFTADDGIEGGDGFDTWTADFDQNGVGGLPGNVTFTMNPIGLVLSIPGATQAVPINGMERVELTLLRQASETWQGSALPAQQAIRTLSGNDTLTGGPFNDELLGGSGNDSITGGPGRDQLDGGVGDDTFSARDGEVDTISCGDGTDTVVADAVDSVVGCENVQLPVVVTPPPPPVVPVVPATAKVKGPSSVEKGKVATFKLKSPTAGATFQCKLDKGAWKTCKPAHKVKTTKLKLGKHKLQVRAVLAGVVDPTPSVKKFTITS